MASQFKQKCFYIVFILFLIVCALVWYSDNQYHKSRRLVEEVEYYDSLNRYNKIYYSKTFDELKKENKQLYDSLKQYKDNIDYIIQFYHEKEYNTGQVHVKPRIIDSVVYDTIPISIPNVARTYEYVSEPNDTFQYNLKLNSFTEPNWYVMTAKVRNRFTIVNKEENGMNHTTIGADNGGTISDVTLFKKEEKRNVWNRFSVGPAVTTGYDFVNKKWGIMAGVSATFDLTK